MINLDSPGAPSGDDDMPMPPVRLTIRAMMVAVAVAAIWLYIINEAIKYRARHVGNESAWGSPE